MRFFIADKSHNAQLCQLMKEIYMPGNIEIIYARDPDFFYGLNIEGKFNQAIVGKEKEELMGLACRSIKPMYVNGIEQNFGYISTLRLKEKYRGSRALYRGFQFLRKLHEDKRTPAYLTTIIEDNSEAKKILTEKRVGLPNYIDYGKYHTYAINLNRWKKPLPGNPEIDIIRGDKVNFEKIVNFLDQYGKNRQFRPIYKKEDFDSPYTRDFSIENFYIAIKKGEILGTIAKWDQSNFKQYIIRDYHGYMKFYTIINIFLKLWGYKKLPSPTEKINMFYACFICVKNDYSRIFQLLLDKLYQDNKNNNYQYFLIGFHESDPLKNFVDQYFTITYTSGLYIACWDEDLDFYQDLDKNLVPYLELARI